MQTEAKTVELTELDSALVAHIRAAGADGITRTELGWLLQRPGSRLHNYDISRLIRLVEHGIIASERRKIIGFKTEYVYRLTD